MTNKLIEKLWEKRKERPLIAAHRGTEGGNIVQNTMRAYQNAIVQGADIIETDVAKTIDGKFYMFHTGQEKRVFGLDCSIEEMTSVEIEQLWLKNGTFDLVNQRLTSFDELVNQLGEKTCIVIDRSWFYWEDFLNYAIKNNYEDKIIVKVPVTDERLALLAQIAPKLNFMPIIKTEECLEILNKYRNKINTIGMEIIFPNSKHFLSQKKFIEECRAEKQLLWVNALNINDDTTLAAGFDDDTSILMDKDQGWGELIKRDFDIIQTDWPLLLANYLLERGDLNEKNS